MVATLKMTFIITCYFMADLGVEGSWKHAWADGEENVSSKESCPGLWMTVKIYL